MDKCDCYYEQERLGGLYNRYTGKPDDTYAYVVGVCYGTKEKEECNCNGDRSKCTFYKEKKMTNEQWLKELKGEELAKALIHEEGDYFLVAPDAYTFLIENRYNSVCVEEVWNKAIEHTVKWLGEVHEDERN